MNAKTAKRLAKRLKRMYTRGHIAAVLESPNETPPEDLAKYKDDPVGFAREVLGVELTPDQQNIIKCLPGRVKVNSGHGCGKSHLAAVACLWWFYTRNPSVVVCTAPTKHHVETVLFTEIRLLAQNAIKPLPAKFLPRAAKIYDTPDHFAEGITASSGEGFQGRHRKSMLFIFDEAEDVPPVYWTTTNTMHQPGADHGWIAIGNPVSTSTQSAVEDTLTDRNGNPKWQLHSLSALTHPNIIAELQGLAAPIPDAVSLEQVYQYVQEWTDPIPFGDHQKTDLEWPPGSGRYVRPGPMFRARVQGIRPSGGVDSVWSLDAWEKAITPFWDHRVCWQQKMYPTIGMDVAYFGDDNSVFHVRCGPLSLHHESKNGHGPDQLAERLKELCRQYAAMYNTWASEPRKPFTATDIRVVVESDGGFGLGVLSHRKEFHNWVGVTVGSASDMLDLNGRRIYLNRRAEMWCEAAEKAKRGQMDLSRLPQDVLVRLKRQLLAPFYEIRADGSKQVESKREIKKRLLVSPDDADALLLSHIGVPDYSVSIINKEESAWQ